MTQFRKNENGGLTRNLAEFAVSFSLAASLKRAVDHARALILDCLDVSVLAATRKIGAAIKTVAGKQAPTGPCTVWAR